MSACEHEEFSAKVDVHRLTGSKSGAMQFQAEVHIECAKCGRRFHFLGLQPGIDLQGARVSIDGLEARLAICPEGEQPSPLDRIAFNLGCGPSPDKLNS